MTEAVAAKKLPPRPVLQSKALKIVKPNYNLRYLRFLVYGDSGVGKTRLAASAIDVPDLSPVLFLDADRGTMSIADKNVDVVVVSNMADVRDVNRYVRAHVGEYKTIVLDSLTALYNLIIAERLKAPNRSDKEDPFVPGIADWQHGTFQLRTVIAMLKTAPVNLIATAMAAAREDDLTEVKRLLPSLSKKLAQEVGGEFDLVGYLSTRVKGKSVQRTLQLEPFGGRVAKNRSIFAMPPVIVDPLMTGIYAQAIKGDGSLIALAPEDEERDDYAEEAVTESETTEASEADATDTEKGD